MAVQINDIATGAIEIGALDRFRKLGRRIADHGVGKHVGATGHTEGGSLCLRVARARAGDSGTLLAAIDGPAVLSAAMTAVRASKPAPSGTRRMASGLDINGLLIGMVTGAARRDRMDGRLPIDVASGEHLPGSRLPGRLGA